MLTVPGVSILSTTLDFYIVKSLSQRLELMLSLTTLLLITCWFSHIKVTMTTNVRDAELQNQIL